MQGTKDYKLTYKHTNQLEVMGYSYSDFSGCEDTRKSTLKYIFLLSRGVISWRITKETIVASSTTGGKICHAMNL